MMLSIDEVNEILDDYYEQIPIELFAWLNGGVVLLEDAVPDPEAGEDVYVMGEYCCDEMGMYIKIYYGSFAALLADEPRKVWEEELWVTLRHELTHHVEGLAGARSLERRDSEQLARFQAESRTGQSGANGV